MSTDNHIENVYPGVVVQVYHYPREVFGAVIATFWSLSGTIRLLLGSSTFVLSPHGGTYVLPLVHSYYPTGGKSDHRLSNTVTENYVKI